MRKQAFAARAGRMGRWTVCLLASAAALAGQSRAPAARPAAMPAGGPVVTYSRSFKGSQPAFLEVEVARSGQARFSARMADKQPLQSIPFTASPDIVAQVFALTRKAKEFSRPLEDRHSKVSYMGTKMLAYDDAGHHNQQIFNYTRVAPAYALQQLFEAIGDTGVHTLRLEESMRYDPLGVVNELTQIAVDWDQSQMAQPSIILPVLREVSTDPNLMDIARKRARVLLEKMSAPPKK